VIVVIGALGLRGTIDEPVPDGLAPEIACAAAAAGARVELISKAGDDPAGDAALLALAREGVGHVATLRDPARLTPVRALPDEPTDPADPADPAIDGAAMDAPDAPSNDLADTSPEASAPSDAEPILDAADVALALRYLTDFEVLVAVHPSPDLLAEAIAAAAWTGARLVVVVAGEAAVAPPDVPADALVVAAASDGSEGVGERIGRYAAALSRGDDPAAAYRDLTAVPAD
jgi:sugar/nucleoside kinase (ribokinase family)